MASSGGMESRPPFLHLLALGLLGFPDLYALDLLSPADLDHHALDLLSLLGPHLQAWVWSSCPPTDVGISSLAMVPSMSCDTEYALLWDDRKLTVTPQGSYNNEIKLVINMIIIQRLRSHTYP
jgi:hypothetical protein